MQAHAVKRYASGHLTGIALAAAVIIVGLLAVVVWVVDRDSVSSSSVSGTNRQTVNVPQDRPSSIRSDRDQLKAWYVPNAGEGFIGRAQTGDLDATIALDRADSRDLIVRNRGIPLPADHTMAWNRLYEINGLPGDLDRSLAPTVTASETMRFLEENLFLPEGNDAAPTHVPGDRGPAMQ